MREKRLNQEQAAREARIRAREEEKERLRRLREALRLDGARRAADARAAKRAVAAAKAREEKREARERTAMTLQEADQTAVDRFWGLQLHNDRIRRLAEMERLVWMCRISASNEVMRKVEAVKPFFLDELERRKPPDNKPHDPMEGRGAL